MLNPILPSHSGLAEKYNSEINGNFKPEDYSESIRVFRRSFKRLMNPDFLNKCCEDLSFSLKDKKGMPLHRNPSSGDTLKIRTVHGTGIFRIVRALYRNAAISEREWFQIKGEQESMEGVNDNVISYFFPHMPSTFELTLIREGRLVYIRMDAPEELFPKKLRDQFCEYVLED
jgi:hypothetical protein